MRLMVFRKMWGQGVDWELQIDDNDNFRILNLMTGDSVTIEQDDKAEFLELLNRLKLELEAEDFECFDK